MPDWLTRSPEEHILYDVDVLFGAWPSHPTDADLATVKAHLDRCHIQNALIISTQGALFSDKAGNTETLAITHPTTSPPATSQSDEMRGVAPASGAGERTGSSPSATSPLDQERGVASAPDVGAGGVPGSSPSATSGSVPSATSQKMPSEAAGQSGVRLIPVGTVDLRDAVGAAEQIEGLWESGVRWLRLFTREQGVTGDTPAYRHVVEVAVGRRMVLLQAGDPRVFGAVLAGRGADVVFLDLHGYLLGDFILMAEQEPGFKATTRMLSSPDGIERVVDSVGAEHLVFGSRTPFMDVSPQTLRLRYARITAEERALIAGGNVQRLVEKLR